MSPTNHPSYRPSQRSRIRLDAKELRAVRRGYAMPNGRGRTWMYDLGSEIARSGETLSSGLCARGYYPYGP